MCCQDLESATAKLKYLIRLKASTRPMVRLVCFPFAGSGASFYRKWGEFIPPHLEVWGIQLPGREERFREPLCMDPNQLISMIIEELQSFRDLPFALFGHSMGALLAFSVAHQLSEAKLRVPIHLFISGTPAPDIQAPSGYFTSFSNEFLLRRISELGLIPDTALGNPELNEILLPILRADLTILENLLTRDWQPLDIPLTVTGGNTDYMVDQTGLRGWSAYTKAGMELEMFQGNHFYLVKYQAELIRKITHRLEAT